MVDQFIYFKNDLKKKKHTHIIVENELEYRKSYNNNAFETEFLQILEVSLIIITY